MEHNVLNSSFLLFKAYKFCVDDEILSQDVLYIKFSFRPEQEPRWSILKKSHRHGSTEYL